MRLVRLDGGDDRFAHRQRRDAAALELLHERRRRRRTEGAGGARRGVVEQRAVLRHDAVEQAHLRKDREQLIELAPGDEDELAPGRREPLERGDGRRRDLPVARDGAVEIGGEDQIAHSLSG